MKSTKLLIVEKFYDKNEHQAVGPSDCH